MKKLLCVVVCFISFISSLTIIECADAETKQNIALGKSIYFGSADDPNAFQTDVQNPDEAFLKLVDGKTDSAENMKPKICTSTEGYLWLVIDLWKSEKINSVRLWARNTDYYYEDFWNAKHWPAYLNVALSNRIDRENMQTFLTTDEIHHIGYTGGVVGDKPETIFSAENPYIEFTNTATENFRYVILYKKCSEKDEGTRYFALNEAEILQDTAQTEPVEAQENRMNGRFYDQSAEAPISFDMPNDTSYAFFGPNDRVSCAESLNADAYTLSAAFRISCFYDGHVIGGSKHFLSVNSAQQLEYCFMDTAGTTTTLSYPIDDCTWIDAAAVYDGANMTLYIGGVPVQSRAVGTADCSEDEVFLGGTCMSVLKSGVFDYAWDKAAAKSDQMHTFSLLGNCARIGQIQNFSLGKAATVTQGAQFAACDVNRLTDGSLGTSTPDWAIWTCESGKAWGEGKREVQIDLGQRIRLAQLAFYTRTTSDLSETATLIKKDTRNLKFSASVHPSESDSSQRIEIAQIPNEGCESYVYFATPKNVNDKVQYIYTGRNETMQNGGFEVVCGVELSVYGQFYDNKVENVTYAANRLKSVTLSSSYRQTADVMAAVYKEGKLLRNYSFGTVQLPMGESTVNAPSDFVLSGGDLLKIFVWNMQTLMPCMSSFEETEFDSSYGSVYIVGDDSAYVFSDEDYPRQSFLSDLNGVFQNRTVQYAAARDTNISEYRQSVWKKELEKFSAGDSALFSFAADENSEAYMSDLAAMISEARKKNVSPILLTPVPAADKTKIQYTQAAADKILAFGSENNIRVIDLHKLVRNAWNMTTDDAITEAYDTYYLSIAAFDEFELTESKFISDDMWEVALMKKDQQSLNSIGAAAVRELILPYLKEAIGN